jgi:hypothetical protein
MLNTKLCDCKLDSSGSSWGPVAGFCKYGNEPSNSIEYGEFLDQLSDYPLLKKDFAVRSYKRKAQDRFLERKQRVCVP